jgi:ankyrin repeat protein
MKQLLIVLFLIMIPFALVTASARQRDRELNSHERAFQDLIDERTSPFINLNSGQGDLLRIEALLSAENIGAEIKGEALARASSYGDVDLLHLLIRKGADVNHQPEQGRTILMIAVTEGLYIQCGNDPLVTSYTGNTEIVTALLDAGARVDEADNEGNTSLMLAAQRARSGNVQLLLKAGANVNLRNAHGWTALIYAVNSSGAYAEENLKEIVTGLIAGGAEVNARDQQEKTALAYAVGSAAITQMLISSGAIE